MGEASGKETRLIKVVILTHCGNAGFRDILVVGGLSLSTFGQSKGI
jgi:hypothetical protein